MFSDYDRDRSPSSSFPSNIGSLIGKDGGMKEDCMSQLKSPKSTASKQDSVLSDCSD